MKLTKFLLLILLLSGCVTERPRTIDKINHNPWIYKNQTGISASSTSTVLVAEVTDGDTLRLVNGERVRLIGIDTPEAYENAKLLKDSRRTGQDKEVIIAQGKKASQYTKTLLEDMAVRLEYDVQKYDRYGRVLAYVYVGDVFVNAEIVKQGYAYVMTIAPNVKYADLFRRLYQEAKESKRGLWRNKNE